MSNDPNRRKPNKPQPGGDDDNRKARRIVILIVAALIATLLINSLYTTISNAYLTEITYPEFKDLLSSGQISEVEFQSDDRIVILTKDQAEKPKGLGADQAGDQDSVDKSNQAGHKPGRRENQGAADGRILFHGRSSEDI